MTRFLSQKIRFYSFVCIALLLFVHGYNLKETYLQPFTQVNEPLTFTTFFEYYIANALLRFRIPLLFIISGYIFSMQDKYPYKERIGKRFRTLILPYFFWSAVGLGVSFLWQQSPSTLEAWQNAKLDQLGENILYEDMSFTDILKRWIFFPIAYQLWFIRSLFFYNLAYPAFRWIVTKFPIIWFSLMFILMLLLFQFIFFEAQGVFFFTLGIWLHKSSFPVERKPVWYSNYLAWLFFIGLGIIKTFMAFEFEGYEYSTVVPMIVIHYVSIIAGVMAVWYSGDAIVKWCMQRKWFLWATSFSFVIYGLHVPLLPYLTNFVYLYFSELPNIRIVSFIFVPLSVLMFCIGTGALIRYASPSFYRFITGGRGI
jgi:fucose 4-O-acetylase-like acetyltransferase